MSFYSIKKMLSQEELREMFDYHPATGRLYRKPLTAEHFPNTKDPRGAGWVANNYNSQFAGKEAFTSTDSRGYKTGKIHNVNYQAHRIVWKIVHGTDPFLIDHINGDKSDNRAENLRECTNAENCRNSKRNPGTISQFRGVGRIKGSDRWSANISLGNGLKKNLGSYSTELDAAKAYDAAALEHHGAFATLNFPYQPKDVRA